MGRPRRSHRTREKLLEQGIEMLIQQGYHGTGLKEILEAVGVPKGSFYNYFKSKEDFGAEIIRHYGSKLHAELDRLSKSTADALTTLRGFFEAEIERFESQSARQGCLVGNLGAELGEHSAICREAMASTVRGTCQRLAGLISRAQDQGAVRSDVPAAALADYLLNAWEGALIRMKVEGSVTPLRSFTSLTLDTFFKAEEG